MMRLARKFWAVAAGVFREKGFKPKPKHLSDEGYQDAISILCYHCCDTVPVAVEDGQLYICLAKRNIDPARDEWWVYGGRLKQGEPLKRAAIRHFRDDTGLEIAPHRLIRLFGDPQRYQWANGPGGVTMDVFADTFAFVIEREELERAKANLRTTEYHAGEGIRLFDREILDGEGIHPAMKRIYAAVAALYGV